MVSLSRALRCLIHTSFCCSGVRYCSGGGGPDTMVIIAGGVFYVTPDMDEKSGIYYI